MSEANQDPTDTQDLPPSGGEPDDSPAVHDDSDVTEFYRLLGVETETRSVDDPPSEPAVSTEPSGEPGEVKEKEIEVEDPYAIFKNEDGTINSDRLMDSYKKLSDLTSRSGESAASLAEENRKLRALLEGKLGTDETPRGTSGFDDTHPSGAGTEASSEPRKQLLPDDHDGTFTEDVAGKVVDAVAEKVIQSLQSQADSMRDQEAASTELEVVGRSENFVSRTHGIFEKFKADYNIDEETFEKVQEAMKSDPELDSATRGFIQGGDTYPADLIEKKLRQGYASVSQPASPQANTEEAVVEAVLRKLGLDPAEVAKQQLSSVGRDATHPVQTQPTSTGTGEDDTIDEYYNDPSRSGIAQVPDQSVKNLLRAMERSVRH